MQILNALSIYGQFTASGLAERFGESSGATSYHLRQLERHGFVREVEGKGTGRERWWERVPGGIMLSTKEVDDSPATRAASATLMREWEHNRSIVLGDFVTRGYESLDSTWLDCERNCDSQSAAHSRAARRGSQVVGRVGASHS